MESQINWTHEAAEDLSAGYTRSETIKNLMKKGLPEVEAEWEVDQLIQKARKKGLTELGGGVAALIAALVILLITGRLFWVVLIVALVFIGDGGRRLLSLLTVTRG